ncbi:MAG: RAMP superfamily CRISPR-associated protein [Candidatus Gracilibacteria bacterium]|nr:RAMP superfamily CRISPR-associated protein [Candidatus Gracilibacteria bacterium]
MNKSYDVEIEILTPVHIGDGNNISGIDYICYHEQIKDKKDKKNRFDRVYKSYLYKYNLSGVIDFLDEGDREEVLELLNNSDIIKLRNKIWYLLKDKENDEYKKRLEREREKEKENKSYKKPEYKLVRYEKSKYKDRFIKIAEKPIEVSNKFFEDYIKKMSQKGKQINGKNEKKKENEEINQISQLIIQSFIKSVGRVYIPGSSLKGAIRTVLTNNEIENISTEKDPFKKLIVRDSDFIDDGIEIGPLARKSKKSKDENGEINGDGNYAEFLKPGIKINTKIVLKGFLDESNLEKIDISKDNILKASNNYTKNKIKNYIEKLYQLKNLDNNNKEKNQKIETTIKSFDKILKKGLNENECILNIGFGGGFWFKSFEGNEKHPGKIHFEKYKNKDIVIPTTNYNTKLENTDLENLGFIKLTF